MVGDIFCCPNVNDSLHHTTYISFVDRRLRSLRMWYFFGSSPIQIIPTGWFVVDLSRSISESWTTTGPSTSSWKCPLGLFFLDKIGRYNTHTHTRCVCIHRVLLWFTHLPLIWLSPSRHQWIRWQLLHIRLLSPTVWNSNLVSAHTHVEELNFFWPETLVSTRCGPDTIIMLQHQQKERENSTLWLIKHRHLSNYKSLSLCVWMEICLRNRPAFWNGRAIFPRFRSVERFKLGAGIFISLFFTFPEASNFFQRWWGAPDSLSFSGRDDELKNKRIKKKVLSNYIYI